MLNILHFLVGENILGGRTSLPSRRSGSLLATVKADSFSPDLLYLSRVAFMSYFAMRSVNRIIKIIFLINFDWMNSLSERLVTSAAIITTILSILGKNDTFIASLVICSQEVVERNISTEKSTISGTLGSAINRLTFIISLERKKCSLRQLLRKLQVN